MSFFVHASQIKTMIEFYLFIINNGIKVVSFKAKGQQPLNKRKVQLQMKPFTKEKQKTILIATFDQRTRQLLTDQLSDHMNRLCFVTRGSHVLTEILEQEVDILLLDVDMQGIIDIEILPIIRKLRPRLPVILITQDFTAQIRKVAAEQGLTFQTNKPGSTIEMKAIVSATEKIIEKREMHQLAG